jgi:putative lipoprotein
MKSMFGFGVFLLFLAGIALVMLQGRSMISVGGGGAELTGINWRPVSVGDKEIAEDSGMFVLFEVDGSIKGHGGCNGFFGSLEKAGSGIGVGPLGATRMACPEEVMDRETAFMEAVQNTRDFRSGSGRMSLIDVDGNVLAEFVDQADAQSQ